MNWLNLPESIDHLTEGMTALNPEDHRGLLVVLPHPDDESFAAGGTIARFVDAGRPVLYLCGTYGDSGRRMGSPSFAHRESMRDIREEELKEACQVLGCSFRMMGLRDKTVEFEDPERVAGMIGEVIADFDPSVVITFYPGYGVHPDHNALGHATVLAVQNVPEESRPELLAVAVGGPTVADEIGTPGVYSDIREHAIRKVDALKAHRSQTQFLFQRLENGTNEQDEQARVFRTEAMSVERFYRLPHP